MPKNKVLLSSLIIALLMLVMAQSNLIILGTANPYFHRWVERGEVAPPDWASPPVITVYFPDNDTAYPSQSVSLNFDVNSTYGYLRELYYRVSWKTGNFYLSINESSVRFLYVSTNIADIPEGTNWIRICATVNGSVYVGSEIISSTIMNDYYNSYKITGSSQVRFIVDTAPPAISITTVENKTYGTSDVSLIFTVNESVSETSFSIDGQKKVESGNTTLTGLSNGDHSITVYAIDKAGNIGASETVHFRVEVPFQTVTAAFVAATIVGAAAGLLFYLKRRYR